MKKIAIFVNKDTTLFFRIELIEKLVKIFNIDIICPDSLRLDIFKKMGIKVHPIYIDAKGINLINDLKTIKQFKSYLTLEKPNLVLTYTIKPNLYGSWVCKKFKIPIISTITGLGTAANNFFLSKISNFLYKQTMDKNRFIFVQNIDILELFQNKLQFDPTRLIQVNGSGVNLNKFKFVRPERNEKFKFLFIGRMLKSKGFLIFLKAAKILKSKNPNIEFFVFGEKDKSTQVLFEEYLNQKIINFKGYVDSIEMEISKIDCVVLPALTPEGMSNALLESCAVGRPIITTLQPGTQEIIKHEINGFVVKKGDVNDLVSKMELISSIPFNDFQVFSENARKTVETDFNRQKIIGTYLKKIQEITK